MDGRTNGKPRVAFFDFAGCEGCQLTVVDSLQDHPELLQAVDIVQFREAMSETSDSYDVAFVEGSCTRPADEERLKSIRRTAKVVVALGSCAHLGGVNAIRSGDPIGGLLDDVYGGGALFESGPVQPVGAVIPVDAILPGCPIDRREFLGAVTALLQGRMPVLPDHAVCVECKLRENECLIPQGSACLGPAVRAGCGAVCPSVGTACEGCRGLISDANLPSLEALLTQHSGEPTAMADAMRLFLSAELASHKA
jgi:coenzyme F420-reducing hydrogenase gamma subunit